MNPNETLDCILSIIYEPIPLLLEVPVGTFQLEQLRKDVTKLFLAKDLPLIDNTEFEEIIEKLDADGYIRHELYKGMPTYQYHTTFHGRWFIKQGGYTTTYEREILKNQIQTQNLRKQIHRDWLLVLSSCFAGVGAVGLVVVELLKHFCW